ncbi:hypothetical protein IMX26_02665 [Clostridium sp. 'deep sea']|uniref:hypothetical protein n=1 Tax=Clostridium sp. 'deep sea' TaxID=2779445 RepID=UPI0018969EC1|nr:hypothetical protein [Clostridium sp. 'deep sea']QOR35745.1 hypothetical protein IMX26_02665 [Clostridium sp. 'deep sea']
MRIDSNNPNIILEFKQANSHKTSVVNKPLQQMDYDNNIKSFDSHNKNSFYTYYSNYGYELNEAFFNDASLSIANFTERYFLIKDRLLNSTSSNKDTQLSALEKAYDNSISNKATALANHLKTIGFSHSNRVYNEYKKLHNKVDSRTIANFHSRIINMFKSAKLHKLEYKDLTNLPESRDSIKYADLSKISNIVKDINNYISKRHYGLKNETLLKNSLIKKINDYDFGDYLNSVFRYVIDK